MNTTAISRHSGAQIPGYSGIISDYVCITHIAPQICKHYDRIRV